MRHISANVILESDFKSELGNLFSIGGDGKDAIWFPPKLIRENYRTSYEIYIQQDLANYNFYKILNYIKEFNPYSNTSTPIVVYNYIDENMDRIEQRFRVYIEIIDGEIESDIVLDETDPSSLFTVLPVYITISKYGKDIKYDRYRY